YPEPLTKHARLAIGIVDRADMVPVVFRMSSLIPRWLAAEVAEPLDDIEKDRREEDAEQSHPQHPSEDTSSKSASHFCTVPFGTHPRHHPEDEGERRQDERPQPHLTRRDRRLQA